MGELEDLKKEIARLNRVCDDWRERYLRKCNEVDEMKNIIPVTPQQRTGRWIAQDIHTCHTDFKCSECGYIYSFMHLYGKPTADYTYCPNCGCKMEVQE